MSRKETILLCLPKMLIRVTLVVSLGVHVFTNTFALSPLAQTQDGKQKQSRLIKRYEQVASLSRVGEDVLEIRLEPNSRIREVVAIRICSRDSLLSASFNAAIDPFETAEFLRNYYAYAPSNIFFLRSEDCLSINAPKVDATEIWIATQKEDLPQSTESYSFDQIRRTSLGIKTANRGVRDYKSAVQDLIKKLRSDEESTGIILGYYLRHPNISLQQRMHKIEDTLRQSGLPPERYETVLKRWDKGDSKYPNSEPQYPNVFVIEITKDRALK